MKNEIDELIKYIRNKGKYDETQEIFEKKYPEISNFWKHNLIGSGIPMNKINIEYNYELIKKDIIKVIDVMNNDEIKSKFIQIIKKYNEGKKIYEMMEEFRRETGIID